MSSNTLPNQMYDLQDIMTRKDHPKRKEAVTMLEEFYSTLEQQYVDIGVSLCLELAAPGPMNHQASPGVLVRDIPQVALIVIRKLEKDVRTLFSRAQPARRF
jgi:hypothetical protein